MHHEDCIDMFKAFSDDPKEPSHQAIDFDVFGTAKSVWWQITRPRKFESSMHDGDEALAATFGSYHRY